MSRLRLLFITTDFSRNVDRLTYYLEQELAKICEFTTWHHDGDIHEILTKLPFQPDFILLNDQKPDYLPQIRGLSSLNIPLGTLMFDLHWLAWERKAFITDNGIKHIFSHYRDKFLEWYPEVIDRLHWFPLWANTNVFKDYGLRKEIDFLLMGATENWVYPLRNHIINRMSGIPGFVHHPHPGYRNITASEENQVFVGERYAREINRAKIFLTCDSVFHYPVAKYYEVLACNTLLLAPCPRELKDLGFVPGTHFVQIDEYDFLEKAQYYLAHEEERLLISRQGYELVHQRHSATTRAAQLVKEIEGILRDAGKH